MTTRSAEASSEGGIPSRIHCCQDVFPDVAAKLETLLRERARGGAYDRLTTAVAFADQLTKDLQSVSHDKHMRMRYSAAPIPADADPDAPPTPEDLAELRKMIGDTNAGFVKVERLDGNIGYLRLDYFLPGDDVARRAAAAMTLLASTDALIIDLRHNHGGEPATVARLVSYLYLGKLMRQAKPGDVFTFVTLRDIGELFPLLGLR